ncbi:MULTISPECIES: IS701 family transposase [Rhodococcus]|uniref:IS701 family transposase n=1 Tax=Rhodococcus indonesiensis TaxID=3055869 RepID=A0ABT7RRV2_9NOCA|nr:MULTISPECIES: IS701 family transposase [Rhodococcus]MDM7490370.1 IS701 family transposase [Rhodococcus indonesiensis]
MTNESDRTHSVDGVDGGEGRSPASAFAVFCARFAHRFPRVEPRRRMSAYVHGLLGGVERKNGWTLAEAAGETGPEGMQRLLNTASWDENGVRDDVRDLVVQVVGDVWRGLLIVGDQCFPKRGDRSAGVGPWVSDAGRAENAQTGIFLAYASERGWGLIDRELYLPKEWMDDRDRCHAAGIDDSVGYRSPADLAETMLGRALDADVPFAWVTAGVLYGRSENLRRLLEEWSVPHVLEIPGDCRVTTAHLRVCTAGEVIDELSETVWHRLSHGDDVMGHRVRDWAGVDLHRSGRQYANWLLAGRSITDPSDVTYYLCFGPAGCILSELARVAEGRRAIEECLRAVREEAGLGDYQVRVYRAWYRHVTLSMVAAAYLLIRRGKNAARDVDDLSRVRPVRSRPSAVAPWW